MRKFLKNLSLLGSIVFFMTSCTDKNDIIWKYNSGGIISGKPIVFEDIVFVQETAKGLHALAAKDGVEKWSIDSGGSTFMPQVAGNTIYCAQNFHTSKDPKVFAVDANTGKIIWSVPCDEALFPLPAPGAEAVYFAKGDTLIALNKKTGEKIWDMQFSGELKNPSVINHHIFVPCFGDTSLYIISEDDSGIIPVSGIKREATLYLSSVVQCRDFVLMAEGKELYAIKNDGTLLWQFQNDTSISSEICVGAKGIYFKDLGNNLIAVDLSGKQLWKNQLKSDYKNSPEWANGKLYVTDGNQIFVMNDETGAILNSINLAQQASSSPTINGKVLFVGVKSELYAINIGEE